MKYFDKFLTVNIKNDEKGLSIFSPWGYWGKSYAIGTDKQKKTLQDTYKKTIIVCSSLILLALILIDSWLMWLCIVACFFYYDISVKKALGSAPISSPAPAFKEKTRKAADNHKLPFLIMIVILAIIFSLGSFGSAIYHASFSKPDIIEIVEDIVVGSLLAYGSIFFGYAIRHKMKGT